MFAYMVAGGRGMSLDRSFGIKRHRPLIDYDVQCFMLLLIRFREASVDVIDSLIGSHSNFWMFARLSYVVGLQDVIPFLTALAQLCIICSLMEPGHKSPWIQSCRDLRQRIVFSLDWFHSVSISGRYRQRPFKTFVNYTLNRMSVPFSVENVESLPNWSWHRENLNSRRTDWLSRWRDRNDISAYMFVYSWLVQNLHWDSRSQPGVQHGFELIVMVSRCRSEWSGMDTDVLTWHVLRSGWFRWVCWLRWKAERCELPMIFLSPEPESLPHWKPDNRVDLQWYHDHSPI
jgi:hypothetical protein